MPRRPALASHLLTALSLALPLPALAQISPADLAAAQERAQREAERVFSVIKFHTIRSKPATDTGASKPRAPASPPPAARAERPARAAPAPAPAPVATQAAEPVVPSAAIAEAATPTPQTPQITAPTPGISPAPPMAVQQEEAISSVPPAPVEQDAGKDEPGDPDDVPLRMQHFVPPVLSSAVQATLGAGSRNVRVRLTVRPDGTVSHAEAAAGVPRRLARPATDAILQWQFAPLPQARTADVDIAFRSD